MISTHERLAKMKEHRVQDAEFHEREVVPLSIFWKAEELLENLNIKGSFVNVSYSPDGGLELMTKTESKLGIRYNMVLIEPEAVFFERVQGENYEFSIEEWDVSKAQKHLFP